MKCIVIETSPERIAAKPVTNEDGTPHIYATIKEARAELKANGYSYNRENQRYYIKGTDYRADIIRKDSEEYAAEVEGYDDLGDFDPTDECELFECLQKQYPERYTFVQHVEHVPEKVIPAHDETWEEFARIA